MNLRDDEIAFLNKSERCYCGHLDIFHDDESGWCEIDDSPHHFCSEYDKKRHLDSVVRSLPCPECEKARKHG